MSMTEQKRCEIKRYLLKHIRLRDTEYIKNAMESYAISKTTVYNYIRQLRENGEIVPTASGDFPYTLTNEKHVFYYSTAEHLEEDVIFDRDIAPLLGRLDRNVFDIWRYSFTEMMNNAIEHAQASAISCHVIRDAVCTTILICDNGVGIFQKICAYYCQERKETITLDEAVSILFAGKFTTDSSHHSGEGIFFTSRAVDEFMILSDQKVFAHNVFHDALIPLEETVPKGTAVYMEQDNVSNKELAAIMDRYADSDRGFFKTQLPIAHIFPNSYPVSRSEARRLSAMIRRFEEVTLDFSDVSQIGQGFAHELFVVFPTQCPEIRIHVENACPAVAGMIARVQKTH